MSASSGTVRYALLLDDQASTKIGTFRNNLTQLGAGTTTVQRNIQGFSASLNKLTAAFTAG